MHFQHHNVRFQQNQHLQLMDIDEESNDRILIAIY